MEKENNFYITKKEHEEFLSESSYEEKMEILIKHSKKNSLRIKEIEGMENEKKEGFFKKAFREMKESAKAQHEVDKANLAAVKAEAKANFEENRGSNTWKKAKENAKKSWDDAHMSPTERTAKMRAEQALAIEEANARKAAAEERYHKAKVNKKK